MSASILLKDWDSWTKKQRTLNNLSKILKVTCDLFKYLIRIIYSEEIIKMCFYGKLLPDILKEKLISNLLKV